MGTATDVKDDRRYTTGSRVGADEGRRARAVGITAFAVRYTSSATSLSSNLDVKPGDVVTAGKAFEHDRERQDPE